MFKRVDPLKGKPAAESWRSSSTRHAPRRPGADGKRGRFHGLRNRYHGTNVVAGVTPGKGGQDVGGIPVFNTVAEAVAEPGANTSLSSFRRASRPTPFTRRRRRDRHRIYITEHIPVHDMLRGTPTSARKGVT